MTSTDSDAKNGLHLADACCNSDGSGYVCKSISNIIGGDVECDEDWHLYEG